MSPLKAIAQRKYLKGIVACQPKWEQTPGAVPRLSNLLLTDRGGLSTCDGSLIISLLNGVLQTSRGPWTELFLFQPTGVNRYYIGIQKDPSTHLGTPVGLAVVDGGAGGTLANATYRYKVTGLDGAGGETTASSEVSFANPGAHKANLSWTALANAVGYNVYRTAAGGGANSEVFLTTVTTNAFVDDGSITPGTATPPAIDTTQVCLFFKVPATSYGAGNILATFPADDILAVNGTPGGDSGGTGGTIGVSSGAGANPQGGNSGNLSPTPQIVQFANKAVLALGNGFQPQLFTDPSTVGPITNTFTAAYPNWIATTVFVQGSKIMPTAANAGNFIFTATQGGTSGGGAPTWPQTPNQIVNDNNIIWQNTGATNTSPPPRGAAHAEVYAGSLWVANTNPTTTSDNFDGPTCLKMSDLNNPTSWNPLNTAFLGKDDGDMITGLKAFTIAADGITPTGSLIVFKYFKTFQVIGVFGAADFAIQEAKTDMGCIASRSIQFLPGFGIARLTHLGIAIFDGTNDRLISEEIRPYLFKQPFIAPDLQALDQHFAYFSKGSQSADPPMYMLAIPIALTGVPGVSTTVNAGNGGSFSPATYFFRVTKLVIVNGVVSEVAISAEISASVTFQAQPSIVVTIPVDPTATAGYRVYFSAIGSGKYMAYAVVAGTTEFFSSAAFNVSGSPQVGTGGLTRILCYDLVLKAWTVIDLPFAISVLKQVRAIGTNPITVTGGFNDGSVRRLQSNDVTFDGTPVAWSMRSPEVFGKLAASRVYYRRLTIRGTTTQTNLTFNAIVNLDGQDGVVIPVSMYQLGNQLGTFDFLAQVDIGFTNYTSHVTLTGTGTIEITSLDWEADVLREGLPPVI